ncbi:polyprotein [Phytophthora megakarya]|uniref:Polyprotein n=1 Tax=Phytophthora megakarya TaxID=4795 RepID=A0A225WBM4_9STRA|nr:polyprotein [Phytophthora megakarya]
MLVALVYHWILNSIPCEIENLHNRVQLRKEHHDFGMASGGNLMEHLMVFNDICLRLTGVRDLLAEDERLSILFSNLPKEYDGMKQEKGETAFQAMGQPNRGRDQNDHRDNRQWRGSRGRSGRGTNSSRWGRNGNGSRANIEELQGKCFECGKYGHKRSDCSQATRQGGKEEFLVSSAEKLPGAWLLDIPANSHMTRDLDHFVDLVKLAGSPMITVTNYERLPTRAKVEFVLNDGKSVCLTDMSYIPGISRKLISVSALAGKGVQLTFGSEEFVCVYTLKAKSEVTDKFAEFILLLENQTQRRVNVIRSENGGEQTAKKFAQFCL